METWNTALANVLPMSPLLSAFPAATARDRLRKELCIFKTENRICNMNLASGSRAQQKYAENANGILGDVTSVYRATNYHKAGGAIVGTLSAVLGALAVNSFAGEWESGAACVIGALLGVALCTATRMRFLQDKDDLSIARVDLQTILDQVITGFDPAAGISDDVADEIKKRVLAFAKVSETNEAAFQACTGVSFLLGTTVAIWLADSEQGRVNYLRSALPLYSGLMPVGSLALAGCLSVMLPTLLP